MNCPKCNNELTEELKRQIYSEMGRNFEKRRKDRPTIEYMKELAKKRWAK